MYFFQKYDLRSDFLKPFQIADNQVVGFGQLEKPKALDEYNVNGKLPIILHLIYDLHDFKSDTTYELHHLTDFECQDGLNHFTRFNSLEKFSQKKEI